MTGHGFRARHQRRTMMQAWADFIDAQKEDAPNVVSAKSGKHVRSLI
jgi:hypothetical protein